MNNNKRDDLSLNNRGSKVLIRGIGIVSPLGLNKDDFWFKLNSVCADDGFYLSRFKSVDTKKSYDYGAVKDFSLSNYYDEKYIHRLDRASEFAAAAAKQSLQDSRVDLDEYEYTQKGVCLGISNSIATSMSDFDESVLVNGPRRCDIGIFPNAVMCAAASRIAIFEGIKGPNTTFSSGKNSGLDAIGFAFLQIKFEEKKVMVAGGTEALSQKILNGLESEDFLLSGGQRMNIESRRGRFVPTEGACILVLSAADKDVEAYAEILAFNDSFAPYKKRNVIARARTLADNIQRTLEEANLLAESIDAIILSSYFDSVDREVENMAIKTIFSKIAPNQAPIFAFKKVIGENFSAFGAMQVICAVGLLRNKFSQLAVDRFNINSFPFVIKKINRVLIISLDSAGHTGSIIISSPNNQGGGAVL